MSEECQSSSWKSVWCNPYIEREVQYITLNSTSGKQDEYEGGLCKSSTTKYVYVIPVNSETSRIHIWPL